MITVETRFRDRVAEVEHYFKLLNAVEDALVERGSSWRSGRRRLPKVLADDLSLKLLKATSFLLLYNLIEATVRDAVESIWRAVGASGSTALELLPTLQDVWVASEFKRRDAFSAAPNVYRDVAIAILRGATGGCVPVIEFKGVVAGGSIDNAAIKRMCLSHGIRFNAPKNTRDGVDLATVKARRNILAHGEQTFEEIGASYAVSDLRDMKSRAVTYLRQYVRRVDIYIANESFRVA